MSLILNHPVTGRWHAAYAWSDERGGLGLTTRYFRRTFAVDDVPTHFIVHVSADSRYRLWVNGIPVGRGPLKGTLEHYFYETYDLSPYLQPGNNLIAAEVRWFGKHAPTSEIHSYRAGFLFQGPAGASLDTPPDWKVWVDHALTPDTTAYIANASNFLGHMERLDGRAYPHGWRALAYDDTAWGSAIYADVADVDDTWGTFHPRQTLVPREIPALLEEPRRFTGMRYHKQEIAHHFGTSPSGWTWEAGQGGEFVLDAGALTTGYPELHFTGGAGRKVSIIYSECAVKIAPGNYPLNIKAVRDDFDFGDACGYQDTLILPGDEFAYEPFHWRTFWYIKIKVAPGDTPMTIKDVRYRFTTYPQTLKATFASAIPNTPQLWDISWRTLQLCAHETYEDCPYFEQLNYLADTRLQALCSLALTGATTFPKRALRLYRDSVNPNGLVESRVPAVSRQLKPYFALIWTLMLDDYWQYTGDRAFVRQSLNVMDSILSFWREYVTANGFVGKLPFWHMVDRADGWHHGTPPAVAEGESTYMTSLFAYALDTAVTLHTAAGEPLDAARWRPLADKLRHAVRTQAWSEREGLFLEGPGRLQDTLSQHSQCVAILANVPTPAQTRRILERLTSDARLHRMKFMQSFYLARALEKADGYRAFAPHVLSLWRDAMHKHVTTWPEYPDPTRSDCHAWSSWLAADFITSILGVRPGAPGFTEIHIAPQTAACDWAHGSAPTPHGPVHVDWRKNEAGNITFTATTPAGVPTVVALFGQAPQRFEDGGKITLSPPRPIT